MYAVFAVIAMFIIATVLGSFFSVRTQRAAVIERFGKFNRVAEPGLNFKLPFVEVKNEVSLVTFQLEGSIETKTKDNVFVQLPVKVQYRIIDTPQSIKDAYYKLANPKSQIESYLYNILLGHIPETTLDDVFLNQPAIAQRATVELSAEMKDFGYEIVKVLITDIIPNEGVKTAMNRINEQTRLAVANQAQGDAEYILKVRQAQADAEVKRLEGVGVAQERSAIAQGWESDHEGETGYQSGRCRRQFSIALHQLDGHVARRWRVGQFHHGLHAGRPRRFTKLSGDHDKCIVVGACKYQIFLMCVSLSRA